MPRDESTSQRSALNFRRLLRISVAAQITMIVVVLIVGVVGGVSMIRISDEVESRTGDALYIRGVQNEFERSRLSVREYVNTGDELRLGPFTQARGQILLISSQLGLDLDDETRERIDNYIDQITAYLDEYGQASVQLKKSTKKECFIIGLRYDH